MHLLAPGMMPPAGGFRHHDGGGNDLTPMLKLGTFSEHMVVSVDSAVKVDPDVPAAVAALVSCGVTTGFGSVANRADVRPGDTVVVVGCGGLGSAALQAAKIAGASNIVAVDPAESKREAAGKFGATHTAESMEAAAETVGLITGGVMADSVVLTPGVMSGEMLAPAQFLVRKGGTVVVAAVAPLAVARAGSLDHCLAGHCSAEPGHQRALETLGLDPLMRLDLRLGEGSGALVAVPIVRMAAAAVTDVATFEEWGLQQ